MTLELAPVHAADFEALLALRIAAMRESLQRLGRFDPERARARFLASFAPEFTRHVLLEAQRVGFLTVTPDAGSLLLDHLYIHPDHQGRGLGALLLQRVFAEADAAGLELRVGALKESASNRFYLRYGFVVLHETEWDVHYVRRRGP